MKRILLCLLVLVVVSSVCDATSTLNVTVINDGAVTGSAWGAWTRACDGHTGGTVPSNGIVPGQTKVGAVTDSDSSHCDVSWIIYWQASGGPVTAIGTCTEFADVANSYTFVASGTTNPPCTNAVMSQRIFGDGIYREYVLLKNGVVQQSAGVDSGTYLFTWSKNSCSNDVFEVKVKSNLQIRNQDTGNYDSPYDSVPPPLTEGPQTLTNSTPPPPQITFTNITPLNPDSSNAPIQIVTTNTSAANNGTLMGVGDGIVNAINKFSDRNHNDLSRLIPNTNGLQVFVTNNVSVTNGFDTNALGLLHQIATNTQFESNQQLATNGMFDSVVMSVGMGIVSNKLLPMVMTLGSNAAGRIHGGWTNVVGEIDTNVLISTGPEGVTLDLSDLNWGGGPPINMTIAMSELPSEKSWLLTGNQIFAWVVWLSLQILCFKEARDCLLRGMNQRQIQGSDQALAGFNAKIIVAFVFAGVAVALLATLPTAVVAYMTGPDSPKTLAAATGGSSAVTALSLHPLWSMVTAAVPVGVIITAFFNWMVFRYLICTPAVLVVGAIILCLLA